MRVNNDPIHDGKDQFFQWMAVDPKSGREIIYGIPQDVHPVTITYRKDLFDEAGVDPSLASSWREFQEKSLEFQSYSMTHGHAERRAMALSMKWG